MKKLFTLIAMALMTMGTWAQTTISPSAEMAFRTAGKEGDIETEPTAWQNGFPKTDQATIECTYSQRMWAQQMYDVTDVDFDNALKVTLNFTMAAKANYRLGAWIYPDADWTEEAAQTWTDGKCPIVENFKNAIGVYPSFIAESNSYLARYEGSTSGNTTQNIDFADSKLEALKNAVVTKNGRKYINFIITFSEPKASWSKDRAPKYYGMANETADNRPYMTVELPKPVATVDYWTLTDSWKSTRKDGAVEISDGVMTITSGSDNAKRGDIKNTAETFRLDANKVLFCEVACTAEGVKTNAGDRKVTFVVNVDGDAYTVEQYLYKGEETTANGHELIVFDLANVEQYGKEMTPVIYITKGTNLTAEEKTALGQKIAKMDNITLSNVGFTLIGTDDTGFTIYNLGSAASVTDLMNAYGISSGIKGMNAADESDAPAYDLRGVRTNSTKGLIIKGAKKVIR